ncbi:SGNH/GDSL hydrolase family protein [Chryseolinea sp. H1M3-3]|uniref:SGNH/GDSL hydrolase family protein n=1 Tax=Chryseolinea sp. H1M3-3 TaxID=3034144 RepID=UPI0023EBFEBB|nr:SGNH/GDSL hydrolase family protein [Chryseolinea sp. H1M3-3]
MKLPYAIQLFVFLFLFLTVNEIQGQNSDRFKKEVDSIVALNQAVNKSDLILFTGSSSIRLWKDLTSSFPNCNIVNLGFGGSEMADLLYFTDQLILSFKPKQIFIYEGDNDISAGRTDEQILLAADKILTRIRKDLPQAEVIFISPKPSLKRWGLKEKYETFNAKLNAWTQSKKNVRYADVWTPMLDQNGTVMNDIFIEDGLHLNKKGYAIWTTTLKKYVNAKSTQ